MRRGGRPPIEPSRELVHLYKSQRLTAAEIARRLFMSESAVYRHLDKAGVRRRPRGVDPTRRAISTDNPRSST